MRSTLLLLLALTAIAFEGYAQGTSNTSSSTLGQEQVYTIEQLQEDFSIFRGALEAIHPGLYRYSTTGEMDTYFDTGYESLSHPMTELDFIKKLASIISKIGCGHTGSYPSDDLRTQLQKEIKLFPLKLKFIDNHAYCLQNNSNDTISIRPGNEVLSINKYSIRSLLNGLYKITSGDGFNLTGKRWFIEEQLRYMFVLFFDRPEIYNIDHGTRDGNIKNKDVKALHLKEIESKSKKYAELKVQSQDRITLDFLSQSTALLNISLFMDWKKADKKVKFKEELKKSFVKIDSSNVNNLIIDLRGNGGGRDEYGLNLFSYLYDKPIIEYNRIEYKTRKTEYLKYSTWRKMWLNKNKKLNDSTFVEVKEKTLRMYGPSFPQFKGELYILINGGCYSTTGDFSAIAKSYQIGTIIGEEAGSAYYGTNSGSTPFFKLPNTEIKIRIPIARFTTNVRPISDKGRGTMPDHHVEPSIQDAIKGVDTEMNFTLDLINDSEKIK